MQAEIDTGDSVKNLRSGDTWIVACVDHHYLSWCGYPEGWARVQDCKLVRKASEQERVTMLKALAKLPDERDKRVRVARARLGWYSDPTKERLA